MGIKNYLKIKKHTKYVYNRVVEIRRDILLDAIQQRKVDNKKVELFLKYNSRLLRLENQ